MVRTSFLTLFLVATWLQTYTTVAGFEGEDAKDVGQAFAGGIFGEPESLLAGAIPDAKALLKTPQLSKRSDTKTSGSGTAIASGEENATDASVVGGLGTESLIGNVVRRRDVAGAGGITGTVAPVLKTAGVDRVIGNAGAFRRRDSAANGLSGAMGGDFVQGQEQSTGGANTDHVKLGKRKTQLDDAAFDRQLTAQQPEEHHGSTDVHFIGLKGLTRRGLVPGGLLASSQADTAEASSSQPGTTVGLIGKRKREALLKGVTNNLGLATSNTEINGVRQADTNEGSIISQLRRRGLLGGSSGQTQGAPGANSVSVVELRRRGSGSEMARRATRLMSASERMAHAREGVVVDSQIKAEQSLDRRGNNQDDDRKHQMEEYEKDIEEQHKKKLEEQEKMQEEQDELRKQRLEDQEQTMEDQAEFPTANPVSMNPPVTGNPAAAPADNTNSQPKVAAQGSNGPTHVSLISLKRRMGENVLKAMKL